MTGIMAAALVGPIGLLVSLIAALFAVPYAIQTVAAPRAVTKSTATLEAGVLNVEALKLAIPRASVRQGLEAGGDGSVLLDLDRGETLRLHFAAGEDGGERLLAALGIGAAQRTTRVPLRRMLGRFTIGFVTFFVGLIPAGMGAVWLGHLLGHVMGPGFVLPLVFGLTTLLTAAIVARFGSPHVIIGSDGIRIRGMLRQPFIRYSEIKSVRKVGWLIVLDLEDGTRRELPVIAVEDARIAGLVRRIERARRGLDDGRSFLAESLASAGRPVAEWRASLESLAKREASFREAPLDREEVERIATDPNADADQRIGAAFVLTRISAEEGREQVRVAADATADEELREALLAAAEGEMDAPAIGRLARKRESAR